VTDAAVSDTGPLIHLGEIDSLDLLSVFEPLYVPEAVYEELERGEVPNGLHTLSLERVEADDSHPQSDDLDAGERAALSVALEDDLVLLTDDLAARESALEHGLDVHGSLGVIARANAQNLIDRDDAASLMWALQRETSLFVTDTIIQRGIQLLDKT
jgi:predicted nucleic acid-binding protein